MRIKIFSVLILFVGVSKFSQAQIASLAFTMGPTFSKPFVKNNYEPYRFSNYSDGTISLIGQYNFNPQLGVVGDLALCNRGMAVTWPVTLANYDLSDGSVTYREETNKYRYSFSYIDHTVMARYTYGKKVKVYANGGMYYSFLLRARKFIVDEYYDSYGTTKPEEVHSKYSNHTNYGYRRSDLGFAVGAGARMGRFGLDYRYYIGLAQVSRFEETISIRSSFSTLKLTYEFVRINK